MFARMGGMLGMPGAGGGGMPAIDPAALERLARGAGAPVGLPGGSELPGLGIPRLPGLGGGGLPPIPGLNKKK
jgi:signal recognition particle subunit SRP54